MARFWNFIYNAATETNDESVELRITGDITDSEDAWIYQWFGIPVASPNAFRKELAKYKGKDIKVWIDSYGGSVFAGAGIYNALKEHDGKVTTIVDGKAISAASVIAMAGDEIQMSPVGMMMIHNPLTSAQGDARVMRKAADVLETVKDTIVNAYQLKTGKSRKKIAEMMDDETWMSANVAVKEGFADKVLYSEKDTKPIENSFTFSHMEIQNSMSDSMKKFFEVAKEAENGAPQDHSLKSDLEANINNKKEGELPVYKTMEELKNACPDLVKQIEDTAREDGKKQERTRIQDIEKISKNIAPDLVNKAKFEEPIDAKELAFQAMQKDNGLAQQHLNNLQAETKTSGVENVGGNPLQQKSEVEKKEAQNQAVDNIAAGGNKRRGK